MLALITLATWEVVAALALVTLLTALLTALWLHVCHWSVKRLVMVRFYYKDGTRKDFITFPWRLEKFYAAIAGNPRTLTSCHEYSPDLEINPNVTQIVLCRFQPYPWRYDVNLANHFQWEKTLWYRTHALLVNVLRDFGLDDNQPMLPKMLSILSHQRVDEEALWSALSAPTDAHTLHVNQVAYLERLGECLCVVDMKKWARSDRLNRFNGKLPGTDELVMKLIDTDEGAKRVLACINRDWKPDPALTPTPATPPHHGYV